MSSDSNNEEENDDEENVYLGNDDVNEILGECDPHHLLYIFGNDIEFPCIVQMWSTVFNW